MQEADQDLAAQPFDLGGARLRHLRDDVSALVGVIDQLGAGFLIGGVRERSRVAGTALDLHVEALKLRDRLRYERDAALFRGGLLGNPDSHRPELCQQRVGVVEVSAT